MPKLKLIVSSALLAAFSFAFLPACFAQSAPPAAGPQKRPMTFEDMMAMKRLGETAVSPDGKWLAYSVTTVDLAKNKKTSELWMQAIAGGEPQRIAITHPGDSGVQLTLRDARRCGGRRAARPRQTKAGGCRRGAARPV